MKATRNLEGGALITIAPHELKAFRTILNRSVTTSNPDVSRLASSIYDNIYLEPERKGPYRQITLEEAIENELKEQNVSKEN